MENYLIIVVVVIHLANDIYIYNACVCKIYEAGLFVIKFIRKCNLNESHTALSLADEALDIYCRIVYGQNTIDCTPQNKINLHKQANQKIIQNNQIKFPIVVYTASLLSRFYMKIVIVLFVTTQCIII